MLKNRSKDVSHQDAAAALQGLINLIGNSSPTHGSSPAAVTVDSNVQPFATRSGRIPAPVQAELPVFDLDAYMNFPVEGGESEDDDNDPDFRPARKSNVEEEDEYVVEESDTASGDEELLTAYNLAGDGSQAPVAGSPVLDFDLDAYLASLASNPLANAAAPSHSPLNDPLMAMIPQTEFSLNPFAMPSPEAMMLQPTSLIPAPVQTPLNGNLPFNKPVSVMPEQLQGAQRASQENGIQIDPATPAPTTALDDGTEQPKKRGRGRPKKDPTAPPKPKPQPRKVIPPEMRAQVKAERNKRFAKESKERQKKVQEDRLKRLEDLESENAALKAEGNLLKQENAMLRSMMASTSSTTSVGTGRTATHWTPANSTTQIPLQSNSLNGIIWPSNTSTL